LSASFWPAAVRGREQTQRRLCATEQTLQPPDSTAVDAPFIAFRPIALIETWFEAGGGTTAVGLPRHMADLVPTHQVDQPQAVVALELLDAAYRHGTSDSQRPIDRYTPRSKASYTPMKRGSTKGSV
jgi:hypothetical protein